MARLLGRVGPGEPHAAWGLADKDSDGVAVEDANHATGEGRGVSVV